MKNIVKRLFLVLLSVMLVLSLASCGTEDMQNAELIKIPDLSDVDELSAKNVLSSNGLIPRVEYIHDDSVDEGYVIKTDPEMGEEVEKNTPVTIYVSKKDVNPDSDANQDSEKETVKTENKKPVKDENKKPVADDTKVCSHSFGKATCIAPATCTKCGTTSGSVKGHLYANATCTTPSKCSTCGETKGSALGHKNNENGVCSICKKDALVEDLNQGFKAYLIIPGVGSPNNHYVNVRYVNNSGHDVGLHFVVHANGKKCSQHDIGNYYELSPGSESVVRFDRDESDMYLDNNSQAWTLVSIDGQYLYMKFDINGKTVFARNNSDIGVY